MAAATASSGSGASVPGAPPAAAVAPPVKEVQATDQVTISVVDPPANLAVVIDGAGAGRPPVHLVRDSGRHELRFEAPGFRPRVMQLDSTKDLAIVLSLKRRAPGSGGAHAGSPPAGTAASDGARSASGPAAAYQPPQPAAQTEPAYQPVSQPAAETAPPPERKKSGRFRHGVDAVSDFAKRHFGTAGSR